MKKKKAFTLVEILGVVALIGILITVTAVHMNTAWRNNQIDVCESELRDMSAGFKSYLTDYGSIAVSSDINYEAVVTEVTALLNKQYLPCEFQIDEIAGDRKSIKLSATKKSDPWGNKYKAAVYTYSAEDRDNVTGLIIITSSGPDGKSNAETYKDGNYGDDIIVVVEPK